MGKLRTALVLDQFMWEFVYQMGKRSPRPLTIARNKVSAPTRNLSTRTSSKEHGGAEGNTDLKLAGWFETTKNHNFHPGLNPLWNLSAQLLKLSEIEHFEVSKWYRQYSSEINMLVRNYQKTQLPPRVESPVKSECTTPKTHRDRAVWSQQVMQGLLTMLRNTDLL